MRTWLKGAALRFCSRSARSNCAWVNNPAATSRAPSERLCEGGLALMVGWMAVMIQIRNPKPEIRKKSEARRWVGRVAQRAAYGERAAAGADRRVPCGRSAFV